MYIFPAIDLKDGKVVRLTRGDYNCVDVYSSEPAAVAKQFASDGAKFLHVVDLDGAKDGELSNYSAVQQIIKATDMKVEIGGGIRDLERVQKYLDAGAFRVILGTAAIKNPEFLKQAVEQHGEKIAVGVDAKDGFVAVDGWLNVTDTNGVEFCKKLCEMGVKNVIYTDIACDGAMAGTNIEIYGVLSGIKGLNITASGGISSMQEIETLSKMGIHSAIVGKAIYTGAIDLKAAVVLATEGE